MTARLPEIREIRAVIDRAYNGNPIPQLVCSARDVICCAGMFSAHKSGRAECLSLQGFLLVSVLCNSSHAFFNYDRSTN